MARSRSNSRSGTEGGLSLHHTIPPVCFAVGLVACLLLATPSTSGPLVLDASQESMFAYLGGCLTANVNAAGELAGVVWAVLAATLAFVLSWSYAYFGQDGQVALTNPSKWEWNARLAPLHGFLAGLTVLSFHYSLV